MHGRFMQRRIVVQCFYFVNADVVNMYAENTHTAGPPYLNPYYHQTRPNHDSVFSIFLTLITNSNATEGGSNQQKVVRFLLQSLMQ